MRNDAQNSRLKSHLKKEAYRNIIFAILGIGLVIALLFIFGTNILISFSLLAGKLSGNSSDSSPSTTQDTTYVAPPNLDSPFTATNSASVAITGSGQQDQKIRLFLNDKQVGETNVKSDNTFTFSNIKLNDGDNALKAKALGANDKMSDYSNEIHITLSNKAPNLTVDNPQDGQVFNKSGGAVKVSGKTDPGVNVTVNDFRAIVDDNGNFSYLYTLTDGDNHLKIVASDDANNQTTKELTIKGQ